MIQETGRTSRISKQGTSREKKENITQAKQGVRLLVLGGTWHCLEHGGWVGTQRSLDLLQIVRLTLGRSLPLRFPSLFKEPELSFTNICLGSAYHQESNVKLAPYSSSCLKFVGAISSSKGGAQGSLSYVQHQGTLKVITLNQ